MLKSKHTLTIQEELKHRKTHPTNETYQQYLDRTNQTAKAINNREKHKKRKAKLRKKIIRKGIALRPSEPYLAQKQLEK